MPKDFTKKVGIHDADIMTPVDIQDQYIVLKARTTADMLVTQASATIAAGGDGNVDITVPSDELWEITFTNHEGSGADISLNALYLSPDGGSTFYYLSGSHLSGQSVWVSEGNIIRASFHNAGASDETAYLTVIGRKICMVV